MSSTFTGEWRAAGFISSRSSSHHLVPPPLGTDAASLPLAAHTLPRRGLRGPDLQIPRGTAQMAAVNCSLICCTYYMVYTAIYTLNPLIIKISSTGSFHPTKCFTKISMFCSITHIFILLSVHPSWIRIICGVGPRSWASLSCPWTTLCHPKRPFLELWRNVSTPTAGLWTTVTCWVRVRRLNQTARTKVNQEGELMSFILTD